MGQKARLSQWEKMGSCAGSAASVVLWSPPFGCAQGRLLRKTAMFARHIPPQACAPSMGHAAKASPILRSGYAHFITTKLLPAAALPGESAEPGLFLRVLEQV